MIRTYAAFNSKGGVGKTTLLANLGGLLADMGARVLLVDADIQPSLSSAYALEHHAQQGLVEVVTGGTVTGEAISRTTVPNLHLIRSNDGQAELQHWLHARPDGRALLGRALSSHYVQDNYDVVLIDTQGAIGPLQTAAAYAADTLISPLPPDTPSIREFRRGTLQVLRSLEQDPTVPRELAPIQAVICKFDYTRDARNLLDDLRREFVDGDRVTILNTVIPSAVAYRDAFTARKPVHTLGAAGGVRFASPFEVMHRLCWELRPDLHGHFAGGRSGDPEVVFATAARAAHVGATS